MAEPVISAKNVGKVYWLYPSAFRRLAGSFINPARTGAARIRALSGLTFDLYPGEALALIGKNGAGKSTALQIFAGILQPSEGEYAVRGKVGALLELGSGFNPEYTGRENIAIVGALAGLTKAEVAESEEGIIRFADIGNYIDQPVKFYSSGMFVRLAFAIAIAGNPDVLIVDEALAVGDVFFRQKCYARLHEMRKNGMAVLLVTHAMTDVQEFCDTAILLENGRQLLIGPSTEVVQKYFFMNATGSGKESAPEKEESADFFETPAPKTQTSLPSDRFFFERHEQETTSRTYVRSIALTDEENNVRTAFTFGQTMRVYIEIFFADRCDVPVTGFLIWNERGVLVHGRNRLGYEEDIDLQSVSAGSVVVFCHEVKLDIQQGEYTLSVGLRDMPSFLSDVPESDRQIAECEFKNLAHIKNVCSFTVNSGKLFFHGITQLQGTIKSISNDT